MLKGDRGSSGDVPLPLLLLLLLDGAVAVLLAAAVLVELLEDLDEVVRGALTALVSCSTSSIAKRSVRLGCSQQPARTQAPISRASWSSHSMLRETPELSISQQLLCCPPSKPHLKLSSLPVISS